ncbi:MAG: LETM1 domain-containing protein [Cystobacterineae bacterium]|nr:LETM1 domain-containing protein [Cystobacterineae bacterium]
MEKRAADWLHSCIQRALDEHKTQERNPAVVEAKALPAGFARVRVYVKSGLRHQGLLFGTPRGEALAGGAPVFRLAYAEIKLFFLMALDIAELAGRTRVDKRELYALALVYCDLWKEAREVERLLKSAKPMAKPIHKQLRSALQALFPVLSQDGRFALLLHNVGIWANAQFFARLSYDYFSKGTFAPRRIARQRALIQRQKAVLAMVFCGILCHQRLPKPYARRSILRQLKSLRLPPTSAALVQRFVWQSMHQPLPMEALLSELKTHNIRHFVLFQVFLASLLEEREASRTKLLLEGELPQEPLAPLASVVAGTVLPEHTQPHAVAVVENASPVDWVWALGAQLKFSPGEVNQLQLEVMEFFAENKTQVDIFFIGEGARWFGEEFFFNIQRQFGKAYRALGIQLRQTGEASLLLAKAVSGQKLSQLQKRKLKEELINLAKVVPALAIFAAPGGLFLLLALGKLLPFSLLPSGFQEAMEKEKRLSPGKKPV